MRVHCTIPSIPGTQIVAHIHMKGPKSRLCHSVRYEGGWGADTPWPYHKSTGWSNTSISSIPLTLGQFLNIYRLQICHVRPSGKISGYLLTKGISIINSIKIITILFFFFGAGREGSRKILEWKLGNKNKRKKDGRGRGQLPRPWIKGFAGMCWKRHHPSLFQACKEPERQDPGRYPSSQPGEPVTPVLSNSALYIDSMSLRV